MLTWFEKQWQTLAQVKLASIPSVRYALLVVDISCFLNSETNIFG